MDKPLDQMSFEQRLEMIKSMYGVRPAELADPDQTYAIFTGGAHAGREFKRIAKPSYGLTKKVEKVRLKAKPMCFRLELSGASEGYAERVGEIKQRICAELGFDPGEMIAEELTAVAYHETLLPLICREELPDGWDIDDVSGYEVERMLQDFLAGT